MHDDQRLEVMEKLQTARRLIEEALAAFHIVPARGTFDASAVDYGVGKLIRARDEVVNAQAGLNPR